MCIEIDVKVGNNNKLRKKKCIRYLRSDIICNKSIIYIHIY